MDDPVSTETVIETAQLRLRAYRDSDLASLVAMVGSWDVAGWLSALPYPYSEALGRDWIGHVRGLHAAGAPRAFAVALRDTDRLIGGAGLDGSGGDGCDEPALGYWVGAAHRGRGYGREAVGAVIEYGFRSLGLTWVRAITHPENVASQRVLAACGVGRVGDLDLTEAMRRGGRRAVLFRVSREAWLKGG